MSELTFGQQRVRMRQAPREKQVAPDLADEVKQRIAEVIDLLEEGKFRGADARLVATAQTDLEKAVLVAVKALTTEAVK